MRLEKQIKQLQQQLQGYQFSLQFADKNSQQASHLASLIVTTHERIEQLKERQAHV